MRLTRYSLRRRTLACISGLIVAILGSQFIISVLLYPVASRLKRSWPFVDYPMYSSPHHIGDTMSRWHVVGIRTDGVEREILPDDLALNYWHFRIFVRAVLASKDAVVQPLARAYEDRYSVRLAALRVEDRPLVFQGASVAPAPTQVLQTYTLRQQ